MHRDHQIFLDALHDRQLVQLEFYSKEDDSVLIRSCAPMDFGPSRKAKVQADRYHFWDFESDTRNHTLGLLPEQIVNITRSGNSFDPASFITWDLQKSPWFVIRDWGTFS